MMRTKTVYPGWVCGFTQCPSGCEVHKDPTRGGNKHGSHGEEITYGFRLHADFGVTLRLCTGKLPADAPNWVVPGDPYWVGLFSHSGQRNRANGDGSVLTALTWKPVEKCEVLDGPCFGGQQWGLLAEDRFGKPGALDDEGIYVELERFAAEIYPDFVKDYIEPVASQHLCPTCSGVGHVRNPGPAALTRLRELQLTWTWVAGTFGADLPEEEDPVFDELHLRGNMNLGAIGGVSATLLAGAGQKIVLVFPGAAEQDALRTFVQHVSTRVCVDDADLKRVQADLDRLQQRVSEQTAQLKGAGCTST